VVLQKRNDMGCIVGIHLFSLHTAADTRDQPVGHLQNAANPDRSCL